jgi:hypothetical protein
VQITDKEKEIAERYMSGDYTEVQLNWILNESGIGRERLEAVSEWMSYADPSIKAIKFLILCAAVSFVFKAFLHFAGLL